MVQNLCNAGSRIHAIARHFFEKEFKVKLVLHREGPQIILTELIPL